MAVIMIRSQTAPLSLLLVCLTGLASCSSHTAKDPDKAPLETLQITGSTTVNPPVAEAAEILRSEQGMRIFVDTMGGSSGGINAVATGLADIGMSSKPLAPEIQSRYPGTDLRSFQIGHDAVALVVSADVWKSGVRRLSKPQIQAIYQQKVRNWSDLGGLDRRIVFFNKEPGRGTWEVFVTWLYGDAAHTPAVDWPQVGGNEEARNKVRSTPGAMTQLSSSWADNETVFALALESATGENLAPTLDNISTQKYPISRPLLLITNGEPVAAARVLIDFMLSQRGQALVGKHGYLRLSRITPE